MKKLWILPLLALIMASCGSDDDNNNNYVQVREFSQVMYNHVVDREEGTARLSIKDTRFTYDIANVTLGFTTSVEVSAGHVVSFTMGSKEMTYSTTDVYHSYTSGVLTTSAGEKVSNIKGRVDLRTGAMYVSYTVDDRYDVTSTSVLPYYYSRVSMVNRTDSGDDTVFVDQHYTFELNPETQKAVMVVNNCSVTRKTWVPQSQVVYADIDYEVTKDGYEFTGENIKPDDTSLSDYVIESLSLKTGNRLADLSGVITHSNYESTVSASIFYLK